MKRQHIICPGHLLDRLTYLLVVATLHSNLVNEETLSLVRLDGYQAEDAYRAQWLNSPDPFETYASSSKIGSIIPNKSGWKYHRIDEDGGNCAAHSCFYICHDSQKQWKNTCSQKVNPKKTWKPLVGVVGDFVPNGSSENFVVFRIHLSAESLSWNMPGVCRISVQHPGKLTWNPEMEVWKMIFLSKWVSLMFQLLIQGWRLSACHFLVEGVGI